MAHIPKTKIKEIEDEVKDQKVSETFTAPVASPAGDASIEFLDKEFSKIEAWVNDKLQNSRYKSLVLTQLEFFYFIIRGAVLKALG